MVGLSPPNLRASATPHIRARHGFADSVPGTDAGTRQDQRTLLPTAIGVAPIAASAACPDSRSSPPRRTSVRAHW